MASREEIIARFNIKSEEKMPYESIAEEPRTVASVEKKDNGALALTWADADGVLYRHTTSQYNPPDVKKGNTVVGGWCDDGYALFIL
jgi:hypothetical protein